MQQRTWVESPGGVFTVGNTEDSEDTEDVLEEEYVDDDVTPRRAHSNELYMVSCFNTFV